MKSRNLPYPFHKSVNGFTLVEILVVIAIIAILSGLIITALNPVQLRKVARDANRKKDLGLISSALEQFYADNNGYPTAASIVDLQTTLQGGASVGPTYMKFVPLGQSETTTEYCYSPDANFQNFVLCAPLEAEPGADFRVPGSACTVGAPYGVGTQGTEYGRYCIENPF
jgi:prepilin-type N-terminal cleavage/methylation domain-containing protein